MNKFDIVIHKPSRSLYFLRKYYQGEFSMSVGIYNNIIGGVYGDEFIEVVVKRFCLKWFIMSPFLIRDIVWYLFHKLRKDKRVFKTHLTKNDKLKFCYDL